MKPDAKAKAAPAVAKPKFRDPTEPERKAIAAARDSLSRRPSRVEIRQDKSDDGVLRIGQPHSDGRGWSSQLNDTFGSASEAFCEQALVRLATAAATKGTPGPTQDQTNAALALMGAIAPRDELEAAMGEQIIATHLASLDFLARARSNAGEYRDSAAVYANMATKVSRTMAAHIEALSKLRNGGKQQVEVRYVYVDARGGQNIIGGNLGAGGGGNTTTIGDQSHTPADFARLPFAPGVQMRGEDQGGNAMPSPCDPRTTPVPDARWARGSPNGRGERPVQDGEVDAGSCGSSPAGPIIGPRGEGGAG